MHERVAQILVLAVLVFILAGCAYSQTRTLTLADMMKVEGFGAADIDPAGRWLIFERLRPYSTSDDYSFRTLAARKTGHQLWRYDLVNGGAPELLPGLNPAPHTYLQGFSPGGKYLAVMQYRYGDLKLGTYAMDNEHVNFFDVTPAFSRTGEHNPIWISDTMIAFAGLPEGESPALTSVRAHTGQVLLKAWWSAWTGDGVTANEVRAYREDRSAEQQEGQLVIASAVTGEVHVLANGLYADLRLSPDRRHLAALSVSKPRATTTDSLVQSDDRRYRLTVFDLVERTSKEYAPDLEFFPYTIAWSPQGDRIAAFGWSHDATPKSGQFNVVDIQSGLVTPYDHHGLDLASERERGWLQRPERVMFLGDDLAVFAREQPNKNLADTQFIYKDDQPAHLGKPDWFALSADSTYRNLTASLERVSGVPIHSAKDAFTILSDSGVFRIYSSGEMVGLTSAELGKLKFISPGSFATRSSVIRPEFTDDALFSAEAETGSNVVMVDLRLRHEGEYLVVATPDQASPLAGSLAANAIAFTETDGMSTKLVASQGGQRGASYEVARVNEHLAGFALGEWRGVRYEITSPFDGAAIEVESCVLLPPGFDPSHPPPLIVEVYPGFNARCGTRSPTISAFDATSPYLWAAKGYAYTMLATPRQTIRTAKGPIAGIDGVLDTGVQAVIDQGLADPKRVSLFGFSQGAATSLYVAAMSDRFQAVIAMNGWADFVSHYFGGLGIYSYIDGTHIGDEAIRYDSLAGSDFGFGKTPFEDPLAYYRNSPIFLAPEIETPVLLFHSDMDAFSMAQFDEMFGALKRAGKDVRYVRYWGEGHSPSSPANIRDMWRRIDDFLLEQGASP